MADQKISDYSPAVSVNDADLLEIVQSGANKKITRGLLKSTSTADLSDFNTNTDARISAQKGVASGVCPLDSGSKIASTYLPSYVDDVLEFTNFASFPGTGSTGIIYVDDSNGKIYRWSGSAYVEISPSPGSSDSVTEGSVNLYFTNARADARVQAAIGTATPLMSGTAAVGTGTKWAKEDHVHPTDTTRAPLASPTFTGTPAAPTPAVTDNSTLLATTAFVKALGYGVGFRNRIINGDFRLDQRNAGAAQTLTAGAALAYTADRFYAYCTGANVTGQQVVVSSLNRYKFTGAASVTGVGIGQRIEAINCRDLAGQTVTLSLKASSSSLTTLNWALYYANTTDTFGTLASPTRTSINSGSFTITSTEATYSVQISVPSGATTGLELVLTGGALLASQTLTIGDVQLEVGSVATPFERIPYQVLQALCYRYYRVGDSSATYGEGTCYGYQTAGGTLGVTSVSPVQFRASPTATAKGTWTAVNATTTTPTLQPNKSGGFGYITATGSGLVAIYTNGSGYIEYTCEL
jgi:hypothetical protein